MSVTIKRVLTFTLFAICLISVSGIALAEKKQGPVWHKGIVTKAAWTEGDTIHIEVDNERYSFLPHDHQVTAARQYKAPNGQWVSEKLPLEKIYIGTEVLIRGEGLEILQLIVEEP